jgi:hypothetical protein
MDHETQGGPNPRSFLEQAVPTVACGALALGLVSERKAEKELLARFLSA